MTTLAMDFSCELHAELTPHPLGSLKHKFARVQMVVLHNTRPSPGGLWPGFTQCSNMKASCYCKQSPGSPTYNKKEWNEELKSHVWISDKDLKINK